MQIDSNVDASAQGTQSAEPSSDPYGVAAVPGDWISECMLLYSRARSAEYKVQLQGVRMEQQRVREWRQQQQELLRRKIEQSRKSGACKFFRKVAGAIVTAASVVARIYCPYAVPFIVLGGTVIDGSLRTAGAVHDSRATAAEADGIEAGAQLQASSEARTELLDAMEEASRMEQRMSERIFALVESEQRASEIALR